MGRRRGRCGRARRRGRRGGLGLDYTVHVIHRFHDEHHPDTPTADAVETSIRTTGSALVASAATTIAGFTVLTFSPLPAMSKLGLLTAIIALASIAYSLTLLPALIAATDSLTTARNSKSVAAERAARSACARPTA